MKNPTVCLTDVDRKILESYKALAEGLADYWGNSCEIVIHSMESLDSSIIKIVNGSHSGRNIGSPVTDVALTLLNKLAEGQNSNYVSYFAKSNRGEQLKASITAIRGENNVIIGLFCVNIYLDTPFSAFLQNFSPVASVAADSSFSENFAQNVEDLMLVALEDAKKVVYNDFSISSSNKNKEIISLLYSKGIFNLKDSVVVIANHLGISKNTVYMHIRNLNGK